MIFHPEGGNFTVAPSTGVTDEAGSYTLWTGDKEGAPAGQYKVTISCSEEIGSKTKTKTVSLGQKPEYKDRLKGAYADLKNSQIKFEITSGTNELQTINLQ